MTKQYQVFSQFNVVKADNFDDLYTPLTQELFLATVDAVNAVTTLFKISVVNYRIAEIIDVNGSAQIQMTDYVKDTYEEAIQFINDTLMKAD